MPTRLALLCTRIIEAGWLAALVLIPLYLNPSSSRIFEADKAALLRSIAVIMALAWAIKGSEAWFTRRRKPQTSTETTSKGLLLASLRGVIGHPILLATVLLLVSHALASAFSILPKLSLWGQYDRLQGLYTLAAYLVFFFSIVALLRTREQLQRIITAVLLVSVPVALYGVLQHFGVKLWRWNFDVATRVFSTMGNAVFLGALLSLAVPFTLYRLFGTKRGKGFWLRLGVYLVLLMLQLVCILYTQSRGPLLGMALGGLFGGMLWTVARQKWRWAKLLIGFSTASVLLLVVINLPNTPLTFVQDIPYVNRLARIVNTEGSSQGRVLIWESAVDLIAEEPARIVVGYGPEAIRYAFYPHHTAAIGHLEGWNKVPDRMHNEGMDVVITTGVVGFLIYVFLFTSIVYYTLRWAGVIASTRERNVFLALWFSGAIVVVLGLRIVSQAWTFSGVAVPLGFVGGVLLYLAGYAFLAPRREPVATPAARPFLLLIILLASSIIAHFVEINVGIGVTATRLYFWIYTALLVVLGLYYREKEDHTETAPIPSNEATTPARKKKGGTSSKHARNRKRKPKGSVLGRLPDGLLTLCLLAGLMLGTIAFSFFSRDVGDDDQMTIRVFIVAIWILVGGFLAVEWYVLNDKRLSGRSLALYAGVAWLPALLFIAFKGVGTGGALYYLVLYQGIALLVILAMGLGLGSEKAPRVHKGSLISIVLGGALSLVAILFIYRTNVQIVQADVFYNAAKSAFKQQGYDVAVAQYRSALMLNPGQGRYQLELAQALVSKAVYAAEGVAERDQLFQDAEAVLREAVASNPYEPYNRAQLAEIYRVWALVSLDDTRRNERLQKAITYLEEVLQDNKQNILFLKKRAELYEEAGDAVQALEAYRELLRWDGTNTALYSQLGDQYRADKRWEEAAAMYEGALRHSKQALPKTHRLLADMYQKLGRLEDAVSEIEQAVLLDPEVAPHHVLLIRLYQRTGRCEEALERARAALQRWPGNATFKRQVAQLALQCP